MITFKEMKNWALVGLSLFILAGCKKYEDGPWVSLRTREARVTGHWEFEYFEVDGVDSTQYFFSLYNQTPYYAFEGRGGNGEREAVGIGGDGYWGFGDLHRILWINIRGSRHVGPYGVPIDWTITRLTNKEMWLTCIYSPKIYVAHLHKTVDHD